MAAWSHYEHFVDCWLADLEWCEIELKEYLDIIMQKLILTMEWV